MYDLANVNEDGGSVVLSPHLSAFLIAAIKVPASSSPPPLSSDAGKSCLRHCTSWLRAVGRFRGFRGASIWLLLQKIQIAAEERALSGHLRFMNKKEDRFSPGKARVLICHPSCHSSAVRSCSPVARVLSQSLFRINSVLSPSPSPFLSVCFFRIVST